MSRNQVKKSRKANAIPGHEVIYLSTRRQPLVDRQDSMNQIKVGCRLTYKTKAISGYDQ